MSYVPVFASKTEIIACCKDVTAESLKLTAAEFSTQFDIVHEGIEAEMMTYLNRPTLTATILSGTGYGVMKAQLKLACIMFAANFFLWLKAENQGRVVSVTEGMAYLQEIKVFTSQIQAKLDAFRIPSCGAVSPDDPDSDEDDIEYTWD